MRLIFDAYELIPGQGKSMGIYNYAKNLFAALVEILDERTEMIVICNTANHGDFSSKLPSIKQIIKPAPGKLARLFWFFGKAALHIRSLGADVYFSPKGFLPKAIKLFSPNTQSVVVIHDLIPLWYQDHFPGYFGLFEEVFINRSLVDSTKSADKVIAISKATAEDIRLRTGRNHNIFQVYNGVAVSAPGPRPYADPYLFAMASSLPHKNSDGILAAYRAYRHQVESPLPLMFCGIATTNEPGVTALNKLQGSALHAYYAYAELFIFLSKAEGFGFPPVEALAHGTPVLCSNIPVLHEITGDLGHFVTSEDPEAIGQQIKTLLAQENLPTDKQQRRNILEQYTWRASAQGILNAIRHLPTAS